MGFVGPDRNIQIVNANGKYMIPGLWDMHVHSAFVSPAWDEKVIYPLYIANGVTGVRDMGGDPDVLESRRRPHRQRGIAGSAPASGGPVSGGREERPADYRGEYSGRSASGGGHGEEAWPGFRQDTFGFPRILFRDCRRIAKQRNSICRACALFRERARSLPRRDRRVSST